MKSAEGSGRGVARECPPVLLLTFTRIDTAKQVFEAIRQAKPSRLYLASDGPRASHPEDAEKIRQVREQIVAGVDWPCEIQTLFQESNLGCKNAPIAGINWLFENEDAGIILEDDCLPHPDFFPFCAEVLDRYKDNEAIYAISGTNIKTRWRDEYSGFFSLMGGNWGWASWRRAWKKYSSDISAELTKENWQRIEQNLENRNLFVCLKKLIESSSASMDGDAWDYQWLFRRILDKGLSVVPSKNLISNIGFSGESTHTSDSANPLSNLRTENLFPITSFPKSVRPDGAFDGSYLKHYSPNLWSRIKKKIKIAFYA